jgi:hypothetical protein
MTTHKRIGELKRLVREAKDLRVPVDYFLDHVVPAVRTASTPKRHPYLIQMAQRIAQEHFRQTLPVTRPLIVHVEAHRLWHGACRVGPHFAQMIYFEDIELGILSVLPHPYRGNTEFFRFTVVQVPQA